MTRGGAISTLDSIVAAVGRVPRKGSAEKGGPFRCAHRVCLLQLNCCCSDLFTVLDFLERFWKPSLSSASSASRRQSPHFYTTHPPLLHLASEFAVLAYLNLLHIRRIKRRIIFGACPFLALTVSIRWASAADSRGQRRLGILGMALICAKQ